jgi:DNA-binding MarR family transcriptional regulator
MAARQHRLDDAMPSKTTQDHGRLRHDHTITLLHQLALRYAAEAFPMRTVIQLLEPEILIALTYLPARSRTAVHLSDRIGIPVPTIVKALAQLHQQGTLKAIAPTLHLTNQGKRLALAVRSTTHALMESLPKLKHKTLRDLHTLLLKIHQEQPRTFLLSSDSRTDTRLAATALLAS